MEAEIGFDEPPPLQPNSPSIGGLSVASAASSVDDLIIEEKFQHKKKLIFLGLLLIGVLITIGVLVFGAHEATDGFNFNSDKVTAEMVLPTTTLTIEKVSDTQSKGTITFQPYNMQFSWESLYNKTHDFIKFKWESDDLNNIETSNEYYSTYLHDISGFLIDLRGDDLITNNGTQSLLIYVNKFGIEQPEIISLSTNDNNDDDEESTLSSEEQDLLNSMINGFIGQYFSELSFKLGSLEYTGNQYKSVKFIHSYAKFFFRNAGESGVANWNFTALDTAVELTNIIILYNGTIIVIDESENESDDGTSSRRLLGDPEHCPQSSPYSRCGNGCFGMCGYDCSCWSWFCGTCNCVNDCHWHDWYCSCDSFWGFWCINVFWIDC